MPVGYMRMSAADDINAPAQSIIEQEPVIIMGGELIAVADHEPDISKGCFNQALAAAGAVHIACHAENRNIVRQADMFKIMCPVTAVNQIVKGTFVINNSLQAAARAMAVGND